MKKWLAMLLLSTFRNILVEKLENNKELFITIINKKLNIPKLDEEQEKKLFTSIYDGLISVIELLTEKDSQWVLCIFDRLEAKDTQKDKTKLGNAGSNPAH